MRFGPTSNSKAGSQHVTPQVEALLKALQIEPNPMSRRELQKALALIDSESFRERYIKPALEAGLAEMTIPNKPIAVYRNTG